METQVELLKECCDIKDAACVRYQKRIEELEKDNRKLYNEYKLLKARNEELNENCYGLAKENRELENKLMLTENDRDEREVKARDLMKKLKEIEKAYIEFEKAETEYDKKLAVLDKLIMNR
jgi:chromosome segregation ATPase